MNQFAQEMRDAVIPPTIKIGRKMFHTKRSRMYNTILLERYEKGKLVETWILVFDKSMEVWVAVPQDSYVPGMDPREYGDFYFRVGNRKLVYLGEVSHDDVHPA